MNPDIVEPCYAVLRTDGHRVTVKEIVWTREDAVKEVDRLNRLNGLRGCRYHWEITRAWRRDKP